MATNKLIWGINDSSHDAALSVIYGDEILFAAHSERYDKIKMSWQINEKIVEEALEYGAPQQIAYFEKRWKKKLRRRFFGGINGDYSNIYKQKLNFDLAEEVQVGHHKSHAAAGYYTSTFDSATIVVVDAIGEFETTTIWSGNDGKLKKLYSINYPLSFGLFYSWYTKFLGFVPGVEEYILMGLSAYGDPSIYLSEINELFPSIDKQSYNFHKFNTQLEKKSLSFNDRANIAAAVQTVYENRLFELVRLSKSINLSQNLILMGGCALNCVANTKLFDLYDNIWIMPNPGDAGSSLGAALSINGRHVDWNGPYLGTNIGEKYPTDQAIKSLLSKKIVAVANGRAEFGPRALGNRSIFADPRDPLSKNVVNTIKKREQFRPFAPVILEEDVSDWFDIDRPSPYMQFAVRCKKPNLIPAVVHIDGTSRVQTVNQDQHPGLFSLLTKWKELTGIPVLLNTSLNIKGQPLLNDLNDCYLWIEQNPGIDLHN